MPPTYSRNAKHPLIIRLLALHENSSNYETAVGSRSRTDLAILRRGMQDRLSQVDAVQMFPALSKEFFVADEKDEIWGMVLAALYAKAHKSMPQLDNVSLGRALQDLARISQSGSLEMRIMAMLKSDAEHLPGHLRQLISILEAKEICLDWNLLLHHLFDWDHPSRYVQKHIIQDYYSVSFHTPSQPFESETEATRTRDLQGDNLS